MSKLATSSLPGGERYLRFVAFAFVVILGGIVLAFDLGMAQRFRIYLTRDLFPHSDKMAHFLLSGTLALLMNLVLRGRTVRIGPLRLLIATVVLVPIVTLEELTQYVLKYRDCCPYDLFANLLGILSFGWLASVYHRKRRNRQENWRQ